MVSVLLLVVAVSNAHYCWRIDGTNKTMDYRFYLVHAEATDK